MSNCNEISNDVNKQDLEDENDNHIVINLQSKIVSLERDILSLMRKRYFDESAVCRNLKDALQEKENELKEERYLCAQILQEKNEDKRLFDLNMQARFLERSELIKENNGLKKTNT